MKYLLMVYGDASTWGRLSEEAAAAEQDAFATFEREAAEAGVLVSQEALDPDAYSRSIRDGEPRLEHAALSGPGQRAGCFYLLECRDAGDAVEWAKKIPLVGDGGFHSIEIRPCLK
jgi:hypothetical protein